MLLLGGRILVAAMLHCLVEEPPGLREPLALCHKCFLFLDRAGLKLVEGLPSQAEGRVMANRAHTPPTHD